MMTTRRLREGRGRGRRRSLKGVVVPAAACCWTVVQCWGCHLLASSLSSADASSTTTTTTSAATASRAGVSGSHSFAVPPPPPPPPDPQRLLESAESWEDASVLATRRLDGGLTPTEPDHVTRILPPPPPPPPPPRRTLPGGDSEPRSHGEPIPAHDKHEPNSPSIDALWDSSPSFVHRSEEEEVATTLSDGTHASDEASLVEFLSAIRPRPAPSNDDNGSYAADHGDDRPGAALAEARDAGAERSAETRIHPPPPPPPPPPPARVLTTAGQGHQASDTAAQVPPPPPPRRPQDESNAARAFGEARQFIVPPPPPPPPPLPPPRRQSPSQEEEGAGGSRKPSAMLSLATEQPGRSSRPDEGAHLASAAGYSPTPGETGEAARYDSTVTAQSVASVLATDDYASHLQGPKWLGSDRVPPPTGLSPVGAGEAERGPFVSSNPRYGNPPGSTPEASRDPPPPPPDPMPAQAASEQRLQWQQHVMPNRVPVYEEGPRGHQGFPGQVPFRSMPRNAASLPNGQHPFQPMPMVHPPRPQTHPRGAGRSIAAAAPAWRSVWRKIERGLDGLAGIEDVVSERAQQLYTSTISNVKLPAWKCAVGGPAVARTDARPLVAGQPSARAVPTQPTREEDDYHFQLSRFDRSKRVQPTQPKKEVATSDENESDDESVDLGKDVTPANLYGALYRQSVRSPTFAGTGKPLDIERVSARYDSAAQSQAKRLILATGGASVPHSVEPIPPSTEIQHDHLTTGEPRGQVNQGEPRRPALLDVSTPMPMQRPPIPESLNSRSIRPDLADATRAPPSPASRPRSRPSSFNEDDEDGFLSRLGRLLPPIPRVTELRLNPFRRRDDYNDYSSAALDAWRDDDEMSLTKRGIWGLFHRPEYGARSMKSLTSSKASQGDALTPALSDLLSRCQSGKGVSLLTRADEATCKAYGQTIAVTDFIKLASLLTVARQLSSFDFSKSRTLDEILSKTIPALIEGFLDSWVPFALVAALLATKTNDLIRFSSLKSFLDSLMEKVGEEAHYASLYLRILSSSSDSRDTPSRIQASANKQALAKVERSRLRFLVACLLSTLVLLTVTVLKSFVSLGLQCISGIASLPHWSHVPSQWRELLSEGSVAFAGTMASAVALVKHELGKAAQDPMLVAFEATIFVVVLALSFLPTIENKRKVQPVEGIDEEAEINEAHARFTDHVAELGGSSASRLDVLSNGRAIESLLERWRFMLPTKSNNADALASSSLVRIVGYRLVAAALLASPLIAFSYAGFTPHRTPLGSHLRWWDSVFDISVIFVILYQIAGQALNACVVSKDAEGTVARFVLNLVGTTDDRRKQVLDRTVDLQLQSSISPTAGVLVKDLWSAHTTRRAWAVRGANLACRNGEIVLLLGDAGSGKSRLLTCLAESAAAPPRMAVTATRVRGSIAFGGVEVSKWGKSQLIKRLGLFLSDVRTIADIARALSGLSVEEILEPSSGTRSFADVSHNPASNERNAMMIALKITGLYSTLLPCLPSRLSTVVTANEDDLRPSSLRPRYSLLSSEEWSKLLIARVLSQAICDNENSASSHENVDHCLIGSYLILDDATAYFSEVDEARFMQDLRRTGAAIIMASNRWATGRLADRILVLRDGAIVESGTHSELLNRGPQQSVYAAKWHAMTSL